MTAETGDHAACRVELRFLFVERLRTADEAIDPVEKSQWTVGGARNADPFALPDLGRCLLVRSEPQRARLAEGDPVQPAINQQGRAQPSRASRKVSHLLDAARYDEVVRDGFAITPPFICLIPILIMLR
jgi:hypothetical protein